MRKFSAWLVSCIRIEFQGDNTIRQAELQQDLFKTLIFNELLRVANNATMKIQRMIRDFLELRRAMKIKAKEDKVRRGRLLAQERVKARSMQEHQERLQQEQLQQLHQMQLEQQLQQLKEEQVQAAAAMLHHEAGGSEELKMPSPTGSVRKQSVAARRSSRKGSEASRAPKRLSVSMQPPMHPLYLSNPNGGDGYMDPHSAISPRVVNETPSTSPRSLAASKVASNAATNNFTPQQAILQAVFGNTQEDHQRSHGLEEEMMHLRQELENQRLQFFYGRGGSPPYGQDGDEPKPEEDDRRRSSISTKDGHKTNKEVKALKGEMEELHRQIFELQAELLQQRRTASEVAQKAEEDIQLAKLNAEASAARAAEALKTQALEEMKTQLMLKDQQLAKMLHRQKLLDQQREQDLRQTLEEKYQELERKMLSDSQAVQERQEALRSQLADLKKQQSVQSRKRGLDRKRLERHAGSLADDESIAVSEQDRELAQKEIDKVDETAQKEPELEQQTTRTARTTQRRSIQQPQEKTISTFRTTTRRHSRMLASIAAARQRTQRAEMTISINKRPARSTKNLEWSRRPVHMDIEDDYDEEWEYEESASEQMRIQQQIDAMNAAAEARRAPAPPPPKKTWLSWLFGLGGRNIEPVPEPVEPPPMPRAMPPPVRARQPRINSTADSGYFAADAPSAYFGATIRRKMKKKINTEKEKKTNMAKRIQHFIRFRLERRNMALNPQAKLLRKRALLHLLKNTAEPEIINGAFSTAMELNSLPLMQAVIDRIVVLFEVYDYKDAEIPISCKLMVEALTYFIADTTILDKGLNILYQLLQMRPNMLVGEEKANAFQKLFTITFAAHQDDISLIMLILRTMYRLAKRTKNLQEALTSPEICAHIRNLLEKFYVSDVDILVATLRFIVASTLDCPLAQEHYGEAMICECVLMSLLHNYHLQSLAVLHCRVLVNLCAHDCSSNQTRLGQGMYPNLLVNTALICRNEPILLAEILRMIGSIYINLDENKRKFQAVGCVELMRDLLELYHESNDLMPICMWSLSCLVITNRTFLTSLSLDKRALQGKIVQTIKNYEGLDFAEATRDEAHKATQRIQQMALARPCTPVIAMKCPREGGPLNNSESPVIEGGENADGTDTKANSNEVVIEEDGEVPDLFDGPLAAIETIPSIDKDEVAAAALEGGDFVDELPVPVSMAEHAFVTETPLQAEKPESPQSSKQNLANSPSQSNITSTLRIPATLRIPPLEHSLRSTREMLSSFRIFA